MANGLAQPVELALGDNAGGNCSRSEDTSPCKVSTGQDSPPANKVIGVVCSGDIAVHRDKVKLALERGKAQRPDAVWVCFEAKSDRITHDLMLSLGLEPVVLPMTDTWRVRHQEHGYDLRRLWRDNELLQLCDELVVFHKRAGNSPWREKAKSGLWDGRLFLVELGDEPKKVRKTRKAA